MKKIFTKITAFVLTFLFSLQIVPVSAFAMSNDEYNEALTFMESIGFYREIINDSCITENGILFSLSYLPNDEISYVNYIKEEDGYKVIISEGNISNEIIFKNNGHVYVDGIRDHLLESVYTPLNASNISPYATVAVSNYATLEEVPGYSYWSTHEFSSAEPLNTRTLSVVVGTTTSVLASRIAAAYGLPAIFSPLFYEIALAAIAGFVRYDVTELILYLYNNRSYIYNPQTLQYLYKVETSGAIFGSTITDKPVFFQARKLYLM